MTKQQPRPPGESKAAKTDAAAREIIDRAGKAKDNKTARLRAARLKRDAALDEALDATFPASDPVEIGHSEHAGKPVRHKAKGRK